MLCILGGDGYFLYNLLCTIQLDFVVWNIIVIFNKLKTNEKILIVLTICLLTLSCTDNQRAKTWGGKGVIQLKPNERLINLTWKNADLWLFVEDTVTHKMYLREDSSWGILNGSMEVIQPSNYGRLL